MGFVSLIRNKKAISEQPGKDRGQQVSLEFICMVNCCTAYSRKQQWFTSDWETDMTSVSSYVSNVTFKSAFVASLILNPDLLRLRDLSGSLGSRNQTCIVGCRRNGR